VNGSLVDFWRIIGNTDEVVQHYMKQNLCFSFGCI
jgi:hypothetical protein